MAVLITAMDTVVRAFMVAVGVEVTSSTTGLS